MADPVTIRGTVGQDQPGKQAEGTASALRMTNRGDLKVMPLGKPLMAAADEGTYFFASNPTPGTGIAGIAAADGYDATETLFLLQNTATANEGVRVYPDFLELACTVVDTGGTNVRYDLHIDNIERFTSGGSAITPVNCNMDSTSSPKATLRFGAVVSPAASTAVRYLGGRLLSSTDLVANDSFRFDFGGAGAAAASQDLSSAEHATLNTHVNVALPPAVLGPGDALLFSINCASQTVGATWSFNAGWYER